MLDYSRPLNNRDLNCMCPLICGFFSINTYYTSKGWMNPWMQNHRYQGPIVNLYLDFQLHRGSALLTSELFEDQLYSVYCEIPQYLMYCRCWNIFLRNVCEEQLENLLEKYITLLSKKRIPLHFVFHGFVYFGTIYSLAYSTLTPTSHSFSLVFQLVIKYFYLIILPLTQALVE